MRHHALEALMAPDVPYKGPAGPFSMPGRRPLNVKHVCRAAPRHPLPRQAWDRPWGTRAGGSVPRPPAVAAARAYAP